MTVHHYKMEEQLRVHIKQNSFRMVSKLFWDCFETVLFQFCFNLISVARRLSGVEYQVISDHSPISVS